MPSNSQKARALSPVLQLISSTDLTRPPVLELEAKVEGSWFKQQTLALVALCKQLSQPLGLHESG
jgi:hypothetical protein